MRGGYGLSSMLQLDFEDFVIIQNYRSEGCKSIYLWKALGAGATSAKLSQIFDLLFYIVHSIFI